MSLRTQLVSALFPAAIFLNPAVMRANRPASSRSKVVAYVPNWIDTQTFANAIDYAKITHINIAFENPINADGDLSFSDKNDILIAKAHDHHIPVLISIGGGAASGDKPLTARYFDLISASKRAGFVAKLAAYVSQHHFDGLDVDLEGPSVNQDYGAFVSELSRVLKPQGKLLTAALSQGYGGDKVPDSAFAAFDWVNIMAYDGAGYWNPNAPGQHSSLEFARSNVDYWLKRGLPKSKAVLGVPFYGYGFGTAFRKRDYPYSEIVTAYPGAENADQIGSTVWYNGLATIRAKAEYARMQGLAGLMIWSLDLDAPKEKSLLTALAGALEAPEPEKRPTRQRQTRNVIFVMTDGLRWQEVFGGAETTLMTKENGSVEDVAGLQKTYGGATPEARRAALLPFLWESVARQGQLYGNRDKGSQASVTNKLNFSYPGYNETLCGFPDPRINSNAKRPNPNVTVLEWLNKKLAFRGKVAAFGAWDVFTAIFNADRCGFPVNAGFDPLTSIPLTPRLDLLNHLKVETPRKWDAEPFDNLIFYTALEYLKAKQPRVLYISLGETDEWAHEGNYKEYLDAAHRADAYLKMLWETVQSMPQYRGKTTLIFSPDHGRGDAPQGWKSHGAEVPGSENIWFAVLGPDTPALGERSGIAAITQNQIAATLAQLLGEDYNADVPQAGNPVGDVFKP